MMTMSEQTESSRLFKVTAGLFGMIVWVLPHLIFFPLARLPYSQIFLFGTLLLTEGAIFFPLFMGFCRCGATDLYRGRVAFSLLSSCFGRGYCKTALVGILVFVRFSISLILCFVPFFCGYLCYLWMGYSWLLPVSALLGGIGLVVWMFWMTRYLSVPVLLSDGSFRCKRLFFLSGKLAKGARLPFFWLFFRLLIVFCLVIPIPFFICRLTSQLAKEVKIQRRNYYINQLREDGAVGNGSVCNR